MTVVVGILDWGQLDGVETTRVVGASSWDVLVAGPLEMVLLPCGWLAAELNTVTTAAKTCPVVGLPKYIASVAAVPRCQELPTEDDISVRDWLSLLDGCFSLWDVLVTGPTPQRSAVPAGRAHVTAHD